MHVIDFYDRHPISEGQILAALRDRGADIRRLAPEDLYDLDQDHYGSLAAVEALARRAHVRADSRVLDVCAGLGGPAQFIADRYGARVVGLDLTVSRCASRQTRMDT